MNTSKAVFHLPLHSFYYRLNDSLSIKASKSLNYLDIMKIILHQFSGKTCHLIRSISLLLHLHFLLTGLQIVIRNLHSQMSASRMNNEIDISIFILIHFYEMISTAKSSDTTIRFRCINALCTSEF